MIIIITITIGTTVHTQDDEPDLRNPTFDLNPDS